MKGVAVLSGDKGFIDDHYCFICGKDNPIGLKAEFSMEDDEYVTYVSFPKELQGFSNVVHGGIISTLMDEVMARYAHEKFDGAVTGEMTVRYLRPMPVEKKMRFAGRIDEVKGRKVLTSARATDDDGTVYSKATGIMIKVGNDAGVESRSG